MRGTTSRAKLVKMVRDAGAREVHLRISSPPHCHPCYYGIDFQAKRELIAARNPLEEIRRFLKLDSLGYLSVDGMLSCVKPPKENYCAACFTGEYAVPPCAEDGKFERRWFRARRGRASAPVDIGYSDLDIALSASIFSRPRFPGTPPPARCNHPESARGSRRAAGQS